MDNLDFLYKYGDNTIFDGLVDICISKPNKFIFVTDNVNLKVHQLHYNGFTLLQSSEYYGHDSEYAWGSPAGICYNDGYLYVTDKVNHVVVILKYSDLKYINHFGTSGTSGSTSALLNAPEGICTDGLYIYVTDTGNNRIVKLDLNLNYVSASSVTLHDPVGIAYDEYEDVFIVVNQGDNEVVKLNKSLDTEIDTVGSAGTGDGEFDTPEYVAVDDQNFYVTDSGNHRIQVFEKLSMDFVEEDGEEGDDDDQYDTPSGIAYFESLLFITDSNDRIKVITNYKTSRGRESSTIIKVDDAPLIIGGSLIVGDDETEDQGNVFVEGEPMSHEVAWSEG